MTYRESAKDKKLRQWFVADYDVAALRRIRLDVGSLRCLNALDISFNFPITAIAGRNGAGKSTILALASCAFHNSGDGFKLAKRALPYYRFSDFFIQHVDETAPTGIEIRYSIAYNNWVATAEHPNGRYIGDQVRHKSKGGKWNDYDQRIHRTVVFLGIERIVPHSERSQSRSYRRVFKDLKPAGWETKVKDLVGYVLGRTYANFKHLQHHKYSLPLVQVDKTIYSGFNMGAGESALFEIFTAIYACGKGSLIVVDEIELGLHSQAQRRFVEKLKDACIENRTQIICTTHSKDIFDCLPDDARFFVEIVAGKTKISESISSEFAFAKLGAPNAQELEILVEDEVAKSLVMNALPSDIRARSIIKVIGSASALARQLAAVWLRRDKRPVIAIFDGDQKDKEAINLLHSRNMAESPTAEFDNWFKERICYLPGDTWPEAWVIQRGIANLGTLAASTKTDPGALGDILEDGLQAGKHNEFFEISRPRWPLKFPRLWPPQTPPPELIGDRG